MYSKSTFVSQLIRAKCFVKDPQRFLWVSRDIVVLQGVSATHVLVRMEDNTWSCDCPYAELTRFPCCHVRALEELLGRQGRAFGCQVEHEQLAQYLVPILAAG